MDELYRGVETSLLALSIALGIVIAVVPALPTGRSGEGMMEVTLPMISVTASSGEIE